MRILGRQLRWTPYYCIWKDSNLRATKGVDYQGGRILHHNLDLPRGDTLISLNDFAEVSSSFCTRVTFGIFPVIERSCRFIDAWANPERRFLSSPGWPANKWRCRDFKRGNDAFRGGCNQSSCVGSHRVGPRTDSTSRFGKNSTIRDISLNSNELPNIFKLWRVF